MKPFDIEKAREGHPVCYRNGKVPDDIHILPDWAEVEFADKPVVTVFNKNIRTTYRNGQYLYEGYLYEGEESEWDLFLAIKKREGWIAMDSNDQIVSFGIGSNKDEITRGFPEFKAVKITWEE